MIHKIFSKKPEIFTILRGPFRGSRVFLNPANSKRMLFGLYERQLNGWLSKNAPGKDFAFDVGAQAGYDTYGLAHLISGGNKKKIDIISFEPEADLYSELTTPQEWPCYSNCAIEIVPKFVSDRDSENSVTLDATFDRLDHLIGKAGLIKIDVEGAEDAVLRGSRNLLEDPAHDWLVEIHTKEKIPEITQFFSNLNRPFLVLGEASLPIIGKDLRPIDTYWLATIR